MVSRYINILLGLFLTAGVGCFPAEDPLLPLEPKSQTIEAHKAYDGLTYYSLRDQKIVAARSIFDWDMAFSCKDDEYTVLLNSAKGMAAYNTNSKEFDRYYPTSNYPWSFDGLAGNQSCIGAWGDFNYDNPQSYGNVYIINEGVDLNGFENGLVKMRIDDFSDNAYHIKIGNMNNTYQEEFTVPKNDTFNFVYLSFRDRKVKYIEPPKYDWDLLITSYAQPLKPQQISDQFIHVYQNYWITEGVLINPNNRLVTIDSLMPFDSIGFAEANRRNYAQKLDAIGSSWYKWNQLSQRFEINPRLTYLIRDEENFYYALKFDRFRKIQSAQYDVTFVYKNL